MGLFDGFIRRAAEKGAKQAVDNFVQSGRFKEMVDGIYADVIREPQFRWFRFMKVIQWHLSQANPALTDKQAFGMARRAYLDFLKDEKIEFGDPRYVWNKQGALEIARAYEIDHWERQS